VTDRQTDSQTDRETDRHTHTHTHTIKPIEKEKIKPGLKLTVHDAIKMTKDIPPCSRLRGK